MKRKKTEIVFWLIILTYFLSRLFNLELFPLFTDEAIYLHWSQMMLSDSSFIFVPLTDGKTPFFMWLTIPFLKISSNPVIAGRILSVASGFLAMTGLYFLGKELFNKKVGVAAMFFYLVSPFTITYDRLALAEIMLLAELIWMMVLLVILGKNPDIKVGIFSGLIWGLALLTKPMAFFFIFLYPLSLIISTDNIRSKRFLRKILISTAVSFFVAASVFLILFFSPSFKAIFKRSSDYAFSLPEILKDPFWRSLRTAGLIWQWQVENFTRPVWYGWIIAGIILLIKRLKPAIFLILSFLVFFIIYSLTGKVIYPRYFLLFSPMVFIILAKGTIGFLFFQGYFLRDKLKSYLFKFIIGIFIIESQFGFDYFLLFNPSLAPFSSIDKWQYFSSWASGVGIRETADFLKKEALNERVLVGAEGNFGNPLNGLQVYLANNQNIEIKALFQPIFTVDQELLKKAKNQKVYLVVNKTRMKISDPSLLSRLSLIKSYPKIPLDKEQEELLLYRVRS